MISSSSLKTSVKMMVVLVSCLLAGQVYAGVNHGLQTNGFSGAASYGHDSGAGGFAGASLVSPLASSGFNSPYGALGGNYLQGVRFGHDGSSAGFGGFGSKGGKTAGYGRK